MGVSGGTGHIATLSAGAADVIRAQGIDGALTVWLMGGDAKLRLGLVDDVPEDVVLGDLGARLDDAADRIERALLDLDNQVLAEEGDRLAWSASLIGDRSPYAGDLQLNAARYLVLHDIIKGGGRHLFFVEDALSAWSLSYTAQVNGLEVSRQGQAIKSPPGIETLRARASALKTHWRQSRALAALRKQHPAPWQAMQECDVIVLDWAGKGSFNPDGPTERLGNMARMPDVLRGAGLKVGFIANPLSWVQAFDLIAESVVNSHDPVVMVDECRGVGSLVRAAWASWGMNRRLKKTFHVEGLNLSPLVELECGKDKIRPQSTVAATFSDIAMTLALNGVRPLAIVYPFENQGWERALVAGARRHLPQTRMIAYQHAPFAARYIGFFPPQSDLDQGRLPDQLVVMGERFEDLFLRHGWPRDQLVLGGSLRFEHATAHPAQPAKDVEKQTCKTILAATSIDLMEALDLVSKAAAVVRDDLNLCLVVNFHPVVDAEFRSTVQGALAKVMGDDASARAKLSSASVADLIGTADVLLYNSSGAVFDAFFAAVPTVFVAVDGQLSFDKVPGDANHRVRGAQELSGMLEDIFASELNQAPDLTIGGCIAPLQGDAIVEAVLKS